MALGHLASAQDFPVHKLGDSEEMEALQEVRALHQYPAFQVKALKAFPARRARWAPQMVPVERVEAAQAVLVTLKDFPRALPALKGPVPVVLVVLVQEKASHLGNRGHLHGHLLAPGVEVLVLGYLEQTVLQLV